MSDDDQTRAEQCPRAADVETPEVSSDGARQRLGDLGASLVEYALLLALIAVVCIAAVGFMGTETSADIEDNASSIGGP